MLYGFVVQCSRGIHGMCTGHAILQRQLMSYKLMEDAVHTFSCHSIISVFYIHIQDFLVNSRFSFSRFKYSSVGLTSNRANIVAESFGPNIIYKMNIKKFEFVGLVMTT